MGYDAMASAATQRDLAGAGAGAGKKKRVNRTAKLKQCKLDARREQWLSQVKNKDSMGTSASPTSPLTPPPLSLPRSQKARSRSRARPAEEEPEDTGLHNGSDTDSPSRSPSSSSCNSSSRKDRPASSGGFSVESSSRTASEADFEEVEEEAMDMGGGENGPLDDWEAIADVLSVGNDHSGPNLDYMGPVNKASPGSPTVKPEPVQLPPRAWRPDDTSRPRGLPSLSKQRSLTVEMGRQCGSAHAFGVLSFNSTCPICCEDLDVTDSTFLPCLCGFHICLFCHKRILEEDGRCPGCRKHYSPVGGSVVDVRGCGSRVSVKMSRSCSMSPRS